MRIRCPSSTDLSALLRCDSYAQHSEQRREFLVHALASRTALLAESNAAPLGFIILEYGFFCMGFVPLIAVAPSARRQGIALHLIAAVEATCRTPKLFTSTNESNTIAQALLSRAGFSLSGRVENLDSDDSELIYYKRLERSDA
jgi:ribosomal protein S18 acetylase RimI-like enzyme